MIQSIRNQLGSIRKIYLRGNAIEKRGDFAQYPETILLLHGFFQTRNIWEVMEKRLRNHGYGVLSLDLGGVLDRFNSNDIDVQARWLAQKLEGIFAKYKFNSLHIIGHSMGGLVARLYIQEYGGDKRVLSLCTLGTPHHGTPVGLIGVILMAGGLLSRAPYQMLPNSRIVQKLRSENFPSHIELTSVFSSNDIICPWWCSVLRYHKTEHHIHNRKFRKIGHSELTHHPLIFDAVKQHLFRAKKI